MIKTENLKNKNIMAKKILILAAIFLCSLQIQAQSSFSIKITQVYPAGGVVYGNMYNLSGELNRAETQLRNKYSGNSANYIMELTRPQGKETKSIQNIFWILVENNKTTNRSSKPTLPQYYIEPTVAEYYKCDIRGNKVSDYSKQDYDYFYRFYKGNDVVENPDDFYRTKTSCETLSREIFNKNKVDSIYCVAKIYDSKRNVRDSIDNKEEYNRYLAAQKQIADSIKALQEAKQQQAAETDSIGNTKTVYDQQQIEEQLKKLQADVDSLKKGEENYLSDMKFIVDEATRISVIMEVDSTFNRNKYFGTAEKKDLKKGIAELLKINKKKVAPVEKDTKKKGKKERKKKSEPIENNAKEEEK
jgi:hypothetical protein